jgi:hypothetical protein
MGHAPGDSAVGKEISGQDEEKDSHDFEFFDTGEQLHGHRFDGHLGHGKQESQHRQSQGNGYGHAGEHQQGQKTEDNQTAHDIPPCPKRTCA